MRGVGSADRGAGQERQRGQRRRAGRADGQGGERRLRRDAGAGVRQAGRRAEDGDRRCFYRAPAAIEAARGGSDRGSGRPADWGEVIPRLTRFFGGSPRVWLYDTPAAVVRAYMRMLPRLEAEEQLLLIEAARRGFGAFEAQESGGARVGEGCGGR